MILANNPRRVLVLGGGDGLALREILKYSSVERVTLVDLDPIMTQLSSSFPLLASLNHHSFDDPRVQVVNEDAFVWIEETTEQPYDTAIVDFPDPNTFALGKLYTTRFYRMLKSRLTENCSSECSIHIAHVRAKFLLVHHSHTRSRRVYSQAVLHRCAVVWTLGLCAGAIDSVRHSREAPRRPAFSRRPNTSGHVQPLAGYWTSARRSEPAR